MPAASPIQSPVQLPVQTAMPIPAGRSCPSCGAAMPETGVLCVQCGFDRRTGKNITRTTDGANGSGKTWLIAAGAAAVVVAVATTLYFALRNDSSEPTEYEVRSDRDLKKPTDKDQRGGPAGQPAPVVLTAAERSERANQVLRQLERGHMLKVSLRPGVNDADALSKATTLAEKIAYDEKRSDRLRGAAEEVGVIPAVQYVVATVHPRSPSLSVVQFRQIMGKEDAQETEEVSDGWNNGARVQVTWYRYGWLDIGVRDNRVCFARADCQKVAAIALAGKEPDKPIPPGPAAQHSWEITKVRSIDEKVTLPDRVETKYGKYLHVHIRFSAPPENRNLQGFDMNDKQGKIGLPPKLKWEDATNAVLTFEGIGWIGTDFTGLFLTGTGCRRELGKCTAEGLPIAAATNPADPKPSPEIEAWLAKVKPLPDPFLAIYYEASRIHLANNTDGYYTVDGLVKQLDSPPPEAVMAYLKERLKDFKPGPQPDLNVFAGRGQKEGSTATGATNVWFQALMKIAWKK